jgi:hypothetical protein
MIMSKQALKFEKKKRNSTTDFKNIHLNSIRKIEGRERRVYFQKAISFTTKV